ncbi:hypothetical protein SAMN02745831_07328 [Streptomyces sp. PgraA7]|nr:hypothetical protein SAMN02745831_07328 [Streptomyces sp. PgraA7]
MIDGRAGPDQVQRIADALATRGCASAARTRRTGGPRHRVPAAQDESSRLRAYCRSPLHRTTATQRPARPATADHRVPQRDHRTRAGHGRVSTLSGRHTTHGCAPSASSARARSALTGTSDRPRAQQSPRWISVVGTPIPASARPQSGVRARPGPARRRATQARPWAAGAAGAAPAAAARRPRSAHGYASGSGPPTSPVSAAGPGQGAGRRPYPSAPAPGPRLRSPGRRAGGSSTRTHVLQSRPVRTISPRASSRPS